jgi:hypothetical protein
MVLQKFKYFLYILAIFFIIPTGPYRIPIIVHGTTTEQVKPVEEEVMLPDTHTTIQTYPVLEPEEFDYAWVLLVPPVLICGACFVIVRIHLKQRQE